MPESDEQNSQVDNISRAKATATTGPDNPLKEYSESDRQKITLAHASSNQAYAEYRSALERGDPPAKVAELKEEAMRKDEELRGLQDLCD